MDDRIVPRWYYWLTGTTVFLSAFLLFQVQPLISKAILPWFGGTPGVWTTSMLFFQVGLLLGYLYAHGLSRVQYSRWPVLIHTGLLLVAVCLLPIIPTDYWKPADGTRPVFRILSVLSVCVGLPYVLLSTTGPLLQAWFVRRVPGRSPYRLYALSNLGSLLALVTYPFLMERWLSLPTQGWAWSLGFMVFAVLTAMVGWSSGGSLIPKALEATHAIASDDRVRPAAWTILLWLFLPMVAVVALLAVTQHVCRDVAVVPMLWVVPLTLYLLSFVICFDHERWYVRKLWAILAGLATLVVLNVMLSRFLDNLFQEMNWSFVKPSRILRAVYVESPIYFVWLFLACMVCHGELARSKPPPRYLTHFYLTLAAGGVLGGIFTAIVCPIIFNLYWELYLVLGVVLTASVIVLWQDGWRCWFSRSWMLAAAFMVAVATGTFLWGWAVATHADQENVVVRTRGFYGVLTVKEWYENQPENHGYALYHGAILHGYQFLDPTKRHLPTTYYATGSGPAIVMQWLRDHRSSVRFGVIGLGTGTMAAYGQRGDYVCFYEINPDVIDIQNRYFTYYNECQADKHIELGDARIQMERQEPQNFDVIFIDAFSGDAIPIHLMTLEAMKVYLRHIKPDGMVAFHISNRYLDLLPVVRALAERTQLKAIRFVNSSVGNDLFDTSSDWVILTNNESFFQDEAIINAQAQLTGKDTVLWTDNYSSLLQVLY